MNWTAKAGPQGWAPVARLCEENTTVVSETMVGVGRRKRPGREYTINNLPRHQDLNCKAAGVEAVWLGCYEEPI